MDAEECHRSAYVWREVPGQWGRIRPVARLLSNCGLIKVLGNESSHCTIFRGRRSTRFAYTGETAPSSALSTSRERFVYGLPGVELEIRLFRDVTLIDGLSKTLLGKEDQRSHSW